MPCSTLEVIVNVSYAQISDVSSTRPPGVPVQEVPSLPYQCGDGRFRQTAFSSQVLIVFLADASAGGFASTHRWGFRRPLLLHHAQKRMDTSARVSPPILRGGSSATLFKSPDGATKIARYVRRRRLLYGNIVL